MIHSHSKIIGLLWVAVAGFFAMALVVGLPFFARSVPWEYEKKIADYVGALPDIEVCDNPAGKAAFGKILQRLFPLQEGDDRIPLSVEAVKGEEINAFASLGAKIYVYEGLIKQAQSAEEIAGVIAHEIEHVRRRHIVQGVLVRIMTVEAINLALGKSGGMDPRLFQMILNMRFSREQEADADFQGLRRLQKAKVDVGGFRRFFEREQSQSMMPAFTSDHPSPENRAEMSRKFEGNPVIPLLDPQEWKALRKICGSNK